MDEYESLSHSKWEVCLGDPLSLRGSAVWHGDREVGRLPSRTVNLLRGAAGNPQLRVANVIRYTCGRYFRGYADTTQVSGSRWMSR